MDLKVVGLTIRRIRKSRGLTQVALASEAGVSHRVLQALEKGEGNPTVETLGALAERLGVSVVDLFQVDAEAPRAVRPAKRLQGPLNTGEAAELLGKYEGLSPSLKALACAVIFEDAALLRGIPPAVYPLLGGLLEAFQKQILARAR